MSTVVPIDAPWTARNAAAWDGQTLETWIEANTPTPSFQARSPPRHPADLRRRAARAVAAVHAVLHRLFGRRAAPGHVRAQLRHARRRPAVAVRRRLADDCAADRGAARLARRARLARSAGSRRSERRRPSYSRQADGQGQARDRRGPAGARRPDFDYEPLLPFQRDQLTQRYGQGTLTKVAAVYNRPFWRDAGLTGRRSTPAARSARRSTTRRRSAAPGSSSGSSAATTRARTRAMSPAARQSAVLNQYAKFFGSQALQPTSFFETFWSADEWTRGCPVGIPATGALLAYGALAAPARRADPLGGDRDLELLERLHGRRGALRRAGRRRRSLAACERSRRRGLIAGLREQPALLGRGEVSSRELVERRSTASRRPRPR